MQIYALADLTASPVPGKSWTLGNQTVGVVITNYSNIGFNLSSDTQANIGTLPPYNTITIPATPGEVVSFAPSTITTTALPMADMFVNLAESGTAVTPNLTALALAPGYVQNVTGTVEFAAGQQVAIQGTPTVAFAAGQQVNIANVPSVDISSGTVTANIANAEIPANIVNASLSAFSTFTTSSISATITNLAAGASIGLMLIDIPAGFYDSVAFDVHSAQGLNSSYQYVLSQQRFQGPSAASYLSPNIPISLVSGVTYDSYSKDFISDSIPLNPDFCTTDIYILINNTTASTIASDTVSITGYIHYSSQEVTNPALNSLKMTPFQSSSATNLSLLAAGGHIYNIVCQLSVFNPLYPYSSGSATLSNGGNIFFTGNPNQQGFYNGSGSSYSDNTAKYELDFNSGVDNEGITLTISGYCQITGYIIHD